MNYSNMNNSDVNAIFNENKIKDNTEKNKEELIEMVKQIDATPVSEPNIEAETYVNIKAPVKVEMNWIAWSEKSNDVSFKSTIVGVGDGEQKVSKELDTPILGQNNPYDMLLMLEGVLTKCDVKKLDTQNDFNTGKEGRDMLRPMKSHHIDLLDSISTFVKSDIFTSTDKDDLLCFHDVSPDELSVGTLKKLKNICEMLSLKKQKLRSTLPTVPFTIHGQTKEMPLDLFFNISKKLELDFPPEFSSYMEVIFILQKMENVYIDEPQKLMEDLNSLVGKLFTDLKLIIVHEQKGYLILTDISKIQFYRITRGNPRFKVIF